MSILRVLAKGIAKAALIAGAAFAVATAAARADNYFEGRTLRIIVGVDAGSGYDAYGRMLARHLARHIPGAPAIVVQNMPGAASVTATDYINAIAPKDGTTIAIIFPNALIDPLTNPPGKFRYDPTKLEYIGTSDSGTRLCYTFATSKVRSLEDAKAARAVMGASARASPSAEYALMLNAMIGTKFEVVTGYKGPGDLFLAMERGEIDGMCGIDVSTVRALRPDWLGSTKAHFLIQQGLEPSEAMTKLGIPSMWKFVREEDRPVAELVVTQQVFQRPYIAPPGTEPRALAVLRPAFLAAHRDRELLDDAEKSNLSINPKSGEEVAALIARMYATPRPLIERMTKMIR